MCGFSLLRTLYKTLCITHLITCLLWRILFKKRQKVATNKSASTFLTSHNKEHQKRPTATLNSFIIPCTHQTEILRFTHSCLFPHTSTWTWTPYQNQQTPFWWEDVLGRFWNRSPKIGGSNPNAAGKQLKIIMKSRVRVFFFF